MQSYSSSQRAQGIYRNGPGRKGKDGGIQFSGWDLGEWATGMIVIFARGGCVMCACTELRVC